MKTIGLIGGLTWYSTLDYYRLLNEMVNKELGGTHSAKIFLYSVEFAEIQVLIKQTDYSVPVFDTAFIHAEEAVKFALDL